MYMQIDEKGFIAGTNADSSRTDEVVSVSQTIAKPNVIRRFFEEMSKKHNVDIDSLNVHITHGSIYISKYTPGHIDMFKVLEIVE